MPTSKPRMTLTSVASDQGLASAGSPSTAASRAPTSTRRALRARLLDPGLTRDALVDLMRSFVRDVEHGRHEQEGWPSSAYRVSKVGLNALVRELLRGHGSSALDLEPRAPSLSPGAADERQDGPAGTDA